MISANLYKTLDADERKLWHSHVHEVKSGMLIMPGPESLPSAVWEIAETKEMEDVVGLYGKTYHFWQVDRGDKLPLGPAQLMMSFTNAEQLPGLDELVAERDKKYGVDSQAKKDKRQYITEPVIHEGWPCYSCRELRRKLTTTVQMQTACGKRTSRRQSRSNRWMGHADHDSGSLSNAQNIRLHFHIWSAGR